jgi:hypothetical protein
MTEEIPPTMKATDTLLDMLIDHGDEYGITNVGRLRHSTMLFLSINEMEFSITVGD